MISFLRQTVKMPKMFHFFHKFTPDMCNTHSEIVDQPITASEETHKQTNEQWMSTMQTE